MTTILKLKNCLQYGNFDLKQEYLLCGSCGCLKISILFAKIVKIDMTSYYRNIQEYRSCKTYQEDNDVACNFR